jgi:hypothetical protein
MTRHLPTRDQTTRCIGVAVIAAVLLSVTAMVSKADDGNTRRVVPGTTEQGEAGNPVRPIPERDRDAEKPGPGWHGSLGHHSLAACSPASVLECPVIVTRCQAGAWMQA